MTYLQRVDWTLVLAILPLLAAGLVTIHSFGSGATLLYRQLLWVGIALVVLFTATMGDYRFLRRRSVVVGLYLFALLTLLAVLLFGTAAGGARSWLELGPLRVQPAAPAKLVLIAVLAKYFDRRKLQMNSFRPVIVSGVYALLLAGLVLLQPDFGSALIMLVIWFGMLLVTGISVRHILGVIGVGIAGAVLMWALVLTPEQKERITSFVDPRANVQKAGYNANQAMIAVGSGRLLGKGVGYGTQSRLEFLPAYETDFIFAAFAEEWGFVGMILLLILYGLVLWRIYWLAQSGQSGFQKLFGAGVFVYIFTHIVVHAGVNTGLLPITGTTLPFMSYGGSHLVTEFLALGVLTGLVSSGN